MGTTPSPGDLNQQLLRDIARLQEELSFSRQKADSLKSELQAFVYAASHDLKEALRNISAYSQLLARGGAADPESATTYAHFILDGVKSANTLIEQLVTLSRAGSSPSRATVNLASCVQTALYKLHPEVTRTGAKVTQHDLPQVTVNQADFDQVFEKVIENAIKYAGPQEPVVDIWAEETGDGHLIYVQDNGPGIPEKFLTDIFQPFKRLHGRDIPGAGVGLALCRKIVEAHNGRLWAESNGKDGSTFKIELPY